MIRRRTIPSSGQQLDLAKEHLKRVQVAWDEPTDWPDLAVYGFYCLENAISAAAMHAKIVFDRSHRGKEEAAQALAVNCGLPDVSRLLVNLSDARKSAAYGDVQMPDLDPEEVATQIEEYVHAVEAFLAT